MVTVSVIIPAYNAAGVVATQLEALAKQSWSEPWEVILADNGSTDGTIAIAQRYVDRLPEFRIVDASAKRGAAFARNTGVLSSQGTSLLFCDADDEVALNWLPEMATALRRHDFVACRIETKKLNEEWLSLSYGPHPQQESLQRIWYAPYMPHAGGGTLGAKRWVHEKVGGFDETLLRLQDTDYCIRIQRAGIPLQFVAETAVHIRFRPDVRGMFQQARQWAAHQMLIYKRYRPAGTREYGRWLGYVQAWGSLFISMGRNRTQSDWNRWRWRLASQIGRLQGSLKYRVPPV